jgi:hypothetical protein
MPLDLAFLEVAFLEADFLEVAFLDLAFLDLALDFRPGEFLLNRLKNRCSHETFKPV